MFTLMNNSPSSGLPGSYCTTSPSPHEYRKTPSETAAPAVRKQTEHDDSQTGELQNITTPSFLNN
jgi:hypothetical protein